MSRTFFWRELRRQSAAGAGMLILAVLLFTGTLAFGNVHSLPPITGFCLLIVPALLGVYAFGPDLEAGQERFLAVLPLSRAKLGALRLGTAAGVVLAVDGLIFASFMAFAPSLSGRESSDLAAWFAGSLLLLPLGALLSVTLRHTLAALGATLSLVALAPTLIKLFEGAFYTRFDEVLISGLLGGWVSAALWLYGRTRALPPLRVAVPLGAAALVVGFLPAPAYGAYRYLTEDDAPYYGYRGTYLLPSPSGEHLAVLRSDPRASWAQAVGAWRLGDEAPLLVGHGEPVFLGDWLLAGASSVGEGLRRYDLTNRKLETYDARVVDIWERDPQSTVAFVEANYRLAHYTPSCNGLIVDRVGEDLWAIPLVSRGGGAAPSYTVQLHRSVEWSEVGYCALNLSQDTRWTPAEGSVVESLVAGWALVRAPGGAVHLEHVTRGDVVDSRRDLPAELRGSLLKLVRVGASPILVGLTSSEPPTLWWRDLDQPGRGGRATLDELPEGRQLHLVVPGRYLAFHFRAGTGQRVYTWQLDGTSAPTQLERFPTAWGPTHDTHLYRQAQTHYPAYVQTPDGGSRVLELTELEVVRSDLCWRSDGLLLAIGRYTHEVRAVNEDGSLGPAREIGLPETWRKP